MKHEPRTAILDAIARDGLAPVAKKLGTNRTALASYATGTARPGTTMLIESNVGALTAAPKVAP
jgi:hypothetical protein